jgi:transcriptional regulator with XRE-family HTH domain
MKKGLPMLTEIREAKGYSLRRLADIVGMSYVALYRLERGETDPRLGTLRKLAKALNVRVAELIGEGKPARKQAGR